MNLTELLSYIITGLVDHPDDVLVSVEDAGDSITVSIRAQSTDIGRIIGKGGKTINAIRALAKVPALKMRKKLLLQVA